MYGGDVIAEELADHGLPRRGAYVIEFNIIALHLISGPSDSIIIMLKETTDDYNMQQTGTNAMLFNAIRQKRIDSITFRAN